MAKTTQKSSSPDPAGRFPRKSVCSIDDSSPSYVHPLGCTLYVVLRLQESVCQKDKEKNRRTRTDSLNGRALYNWVQPCRGILKIYAEYFAFFPLIVCLNSHNPLRAKCGLDHETASRTDRGNTLAHAPNRPIKDDLLNELARKAD